MIKFYLISEKIIKIKTFLNNNDGDIKKKSLRSGVWVSFSQIITRSLQVVRSIILARLLTADAFGVMGIIYVVINGLDVFTNTGFRQALISSQENRREYFDTAWCISIMRGVVISIVIILSAPYFASYYNEPSLDILFKVISFGFVLNGFENIHIILFNKELEYKKISFMEMFLDSSGFLIVISLAYIYKNVWAIVISYVLSAGIKVAIGYKIQPVRPSFRFRNDIARHLFRYGKFITGSTVLVYVATQIDNAFVGKMMDMTSLGYYVLAYTIANIPVTHISHIVDKITFPAYSKIKDDREALCRAYLNFLFSISAVTIPASFGLSIFSFEITSIIYGPKWLPMATSLMILSFYGMFRSIQATTSSLLKAIGAPHVDFYSEGFRVVSLMLTIYPLTKAYGIIGTSVCVTLSMFISMVFALVMVCRTTGLDPKKYRIFFYFIMNSCLMSAALRLLGGGGKITNFFVLISLIIVGILIYFTAFFGFSKYFPTINTHIKSFKAFLRLPQ